jgi:hypothetical protein
MAASRGPRAHPRDNRMKKHLRPDRGVTLGVVILLVFVAMALSFVALTMWAKKSELNREKTRLQALKQAEEAAALTIKEQEKQGIDPTGLGPKDGDETVLSAETSANAVSTRRDVLFKGSTANPEYLADQFGTFQNLITEMSGRISSLMIKHQRAELDARLAKAFVETKTTARPEILKDREQYKARLQQMIKDLTERINEATAKGNESKAGLQAQVDKLKGEKELAEAEFRDFERRETGKIRKMRNDLEQMRTKEVIKHRVNAAHGRVLKPDVAQKNAYIDLGSRERVVPGLRFVAARMGKEGKFEYKALLEVKKVWLETSEVAIVKAYEGGGPVIDGDLIVNPFYNPRRPVIVAFAGHTGDRAFNLRLPDNNPKPLRLSAKEAANRIKEIGSEARMNVTLDADFVIFTEVSSTDTTRDAWPDYKKAVLLEIPLADAADYYEFLGG